MSIELQHIAISILLGTTFGIGLWAMLACLPRWAAVPLTQRIAPHVKDVTAAQGIDVRSTRLSDPVSWVVQATRQGLRSIVQDIVSRLGGADTLKERLDRAGMRIDAEAFRVRQMAVVAFAVLVGTLIGFAATLAGRPAVVAWIMPVVFVAIAIFTMRQWVGVATKKRQARIQDELPTVLEFLALCLSAGETIGDAVKRSGAVGRGAFAQELRRVTLDVSTGSSLVTALTQCGQRLDVAAVSRSLDHLVAAIDRGAPLASVLRDQAADARGEQQRAMLEQAGKKEIAMLFPLVFLILPLSVLIAVFPGLQMIRLG